MSCSVTASLTRHVPSGSHKHHHQEHSQPDEPQTNELNPIAAQPDDVEFIPTDESLRDILSNKGIPSEPSTNPSRGETLAVAPSFKSSLLGSRYRNVSLIVGVCAKTYNSLILMLEYLENFLRVTSFLGSYFHLFKFVMIFVAVSWPYYKYSNVYILIQVSSRCRFFTMMVQL